MKFKQIIGGTEEEAIKKSPWLNEAIFSNKDFIYCSIAK